MDWTQLHLALNHVPVVGLPILLLILIAGWWRRSADVLRLALWALALLAAAAIAIKFTGDFAAEQSAPRLAEVQAYVQRHEQAGDQVTAGVFLLGLASALALLLARGARPVRGWTVALVLVLGLVTAALYLRSAHTGGQISHPILR
jgi:uncharacterized membrane protein